MAINLFGFQIVRKEPGEEQQVQTLQPPIAAPINDDGAITVTSGGYFGTYLDLEASFKNENDLISRYREMAMQPELESAIDDIVNEAIVHDTTGKSVTIILDDLEQPDNIKDMIREEFDNVLRMLDWSNQGSDIFRNWYIDGRLFYQVLIDEKQPKLGIQEILYLDPRKIRKVRSVIRKKDPRTGVDITAGVQEFYVYNERAMAQGQTVITSPTDSGVKIATDAIVNVNSGLMDPKRMLVLSYLHKAIKPLNQLRMVEDAIVIYRLSRAPERRVFYIDVGNMPKVKSEQYLRDIMTKFRNKIVYDSATGEVKDDRKFMSMMEDFWIPRRGEGKNTEITTLPAGQNLGELADVQYFEKKLYKSLNVPVSRLESNQGFSLGRTTEITRDEIKFSKFIDRLRSKFTILFDELMERQLALKGICSVDEWNELKETIHYDFLKDNNFMELKESELMAARLGLMQQIDPYVGVYFSKAWVKKHVLHFDEEGIERMEEELAEEQAEEPAAPTAPTVPNMNTQPTTPVSQMTPEQGAAQGQANDINSVFNAQITK
jgi:Bacteriophage T4-like portal protein (Gp20)